MTAMTGYRGDGGRFVRVPMEDRFWNRVDQSGGPDACWLWQGPIEKTGYGRITDYWTKHLTHRFAYELVKGPIPPGKSVCHSCDVRACCNPAHLWVGSTAENLQDARDKGRLLPTPPPVRPGMANGRAKLTDEQVQAIRAAYIPRKPGRVKGVPNGHHAPGSVQALAAEYGVAVSLIHRIVRREVWTHLD